MKDLNNKVTGDTLPAVDWNDPQTELQNLVEETGQTLSAGDPNQLGKAVATYVNRGSFYTDSGSANTYVLSALPGLQSVIALSDGLEISFYPATTSTGPCTVNLLALGVVGLKDNIGNPLGAGDVVEDLFFLARYDSGAGEFRRTSYSETTDTDDIPEGSTNEYYTEAKVTANASVAANTAKVSNVTTNLGTTQNATTVSVLSSDGTDAVLPQAINGGNAGVQSGADKAKIDGVAAGAEVNPDLISQAEAEAGIATTERLFSALRVAQAVAAQGGGDLLSTNNLSDVANAGTSRANLGLGSLSTLNSVGQGQISSGAIHTDELDTGLFTTTISSNQLTIMSTGSYGFYPVMDHSTSGLLDVSISLEDNLSTTGLVNYLATGSMSGGTLTVNQVFVNASPPYTLGHGEIPYFFFLRVNSNGKVISTTSCPVPPWAYNGPTSVLPDFKGRDGKKYQIHSGIDKSDPDWFSKHMEGKISSDKIVEITHAIKNADMDLLPHSFPTADPSDTIALLDPLSTQKLGDLARNGVEIGKLIEDGHLKITNNFLDQNSPKGVKIIPIKWK